jgi:malonyl-CoA/methylmalonyl-CoA synthetase
MRGISHHLTHFFTRMKDLVFYFYKIIDFLNRRLPLHHVHGLINALLLPLANNCKVTMLPKFDSDEVWKQLLNLNSTYKDRVNLFMAVPTIYSYLIQEYDKLFKNKSQMVEYIRNTCSSKVRLMISGSAPLPETTFKRWRELTGHNLLERYGMTEIGMALSNPLREDENRKRLPGFTGNPLPLVEARIVSYENSNEVLYESKGEFGTGFWSNEVNSSPNETQSKSEVSIEGNLQIKGPTVFKKYFNKPEATLESFTEDGWFITGDSAAFSPEANSFKILGRNSVDILKCKGYKISALEMETKLLENSSIQDCAVIGIPDETLGQKIVALVVAKKETTVEEINNWCKEKFPSYSLPTISLVESVPRNLMGKVNKKELVKLFN